VHALLSHCAVAFATLVVQVVPQVPQSSALLVRLTHVEPQSVGVPVGHPDTQLPAEHTGVPPVHAWPHEPQFALFVCSLTHAPLHSENPLLQENPQALLLQYAVALATLVVQTLPHVLQSDVSLVVFTQVPPQSVWPVAHPEMHVAVPPSAPPVVEQMGVPPVQVLPQAPQFDAVLS
jgi:hypothetical protein